MPMFTRVADPCEVVLVRGGLITSLICFSTKFVRPVRVRVKVVLGSRRIVLSSIGRPTTEFLVDLRHPAESRDTYISTPWAYKGDFRVQPPFSQMNRSLL